MTEANAAPTEDQYMLARRAKLDRLRAAGIEPFPGEAQLGEKLSRLVPERRLRATTDVADAVRRAIPESG